MQLHVTGWVFLTLSVVLSGGNAIAGSAEAMRLVPFPKEARIEEGRFGLDRPLRLEVPADFSGFAGETISAEFERIGLKPPVLGRAPDGENAMRLVGADTKPVARHGVVELPAEAGEDGYSLRITSDAVVVHGRTTAGLRHGVHTLVQLIRANREGSALGCVTIRDWPSLRWRAFQDDVTRGPSSTLGELKRQVSLGAGFKHNLFTYYIEHQYAFSKHPVIGPPDGSLLPEELRRLVEYGKSVGMDILGNQQSFGHFGIILRHKQYRELGENGGILNPTNEGSYRLLDDLYSEQIPLLPFEFFNVCCDETQGLGEGASKELAAKIGVGGVYVMHVKRVHDLVRGKYGKRMMMWGDIILTHPEHLKEIPRDTIMLTWAYDALDSFEHQIVPFAKSGYEFFVCPGVNNWNRILPDFGVATANIRNFVRDGIKHGAMGMINTSWDDDGETLNAPNWHGFAWGAECAWNAAKTDPGQFNRRIGAVLFGERGDHFGQAIELLGKAHELFGKRGIGDSRFWELELGQPMDKLEVLGKEAEKLLAVVRPALEHLQACKKDATVNIELLDGVIFGAERMELIGRRTLNALTAAREYRIAFESPSSVLRMGEAERLVREDLEAHRRIAERYAMLWFRENRPFALSVPMGKYYEAISEYERMAAKLIEARIAVRAGKPLPSPADVGL